MENIIQVLEELLESGDFLVLEKNQKNCYLYSNNCCHLKYSEFWQTTNVNLDSNYKQQLNKKIDISSLFLEFKKYLNNFIQQLIHLNEVKRLLTNKLFLILQQDIQEQNYRRKNEQEQKIMSQEFENINFLQDIIDDYQVLHIKIKFDEQNLQIQFKNPLCIEFKKLKILQIQHISLGFEAEYIKTISQKKGLQFVDNIFENQLNWLIKQENLKLAVKYLDLSYFIKGIVGCSDERCLERAYDSQVSKTLPEIYANYIYLNLTTQYYSTLYKLKICPFENLKSEEKTKILINNYAEYMDSREVDLDLDAIEIPCILENYRCFISNNSSLEQQIEELFLEDQYILMISYFFKNKIYLNLHYNFCYFISDLIEL
ncbi:hypothetical protein ABPG74_020867 [Tetrahymena malaccensis]